MICFDGIFAIRHVSLLSSWVLFKVRLPVNITPDTDNVLI